MAELLSRRTKQLSKSLRLTDSDFSSNARENQPWFIYSIAASRLSKEIEYQNGIFQALLLKMTTLMQLGNIQGAFVVAVSLKTVNCKVTLIFMQASLVSCST